MKCSKKLTLVLVVILSMMCVVFSSCGADLAASAGGISAENAAEEQVRSELEESGDEHSEDAELEEDEDEYSDEDAEEYDSEAADDVETDADNNETYEIVFNSNPSRMRYHLPTCRGVDDISEEHFKKYTLTKEEIKEKQDSEGWIPCGWCHPDKKIGIGEKS